MIATRVLRADEPGWMEVVLQVLSRGGLVAFPTDTVYGVGAAAFDGAAVRRIYEAKGRREANPIPILVADATHLDRLAGPISDRVRRLAEAFWPGPLTIVVHKQPNVPPEISLNATVGVRAPDHPVASEILRSAGPLATSSANRSGESSLTRPEDVLASLGGRIELLVDGGESPGGVPSTVVDCTQDPPTMVREGPVSLDAVLRAWGS